MKITHALLVILGLAAAFMLGRYFCTDAPNNSAEIERLDSLAQSHRAESLRYEEQANRLAQTIVTQREIADSLASALHEARIQTGRTRIVYREAQTELEADTTLENCIAANNGCRLYSESLEEENETLERSNAALRTTQGLIVQESYALRSALSLCRGADSACVGASELRDLQTIGLRRQIRSLQYQRAGLAVVAGAAIIYGLAK